jgi:hypothetical protein
MLQPGKRSTSIRVFLNHREECLQIIADMHRDLRVRKNAPHETRQVLVTDFRNPAPTGVVNRQRLAGMEYRAGLVWKAAPGKIDMSQFCVYQRFTTGINPRRRQ